MSQIYSFKIIRLKFCQIEYSSRKRHMLHFSCDYREKSLQRLKPHIEILLRRLRRKYIFSDISRDYTIYTTYKCTRICVNMHVATITVIFHISRKLQSPITYACCTYVVCLRATNFQIHQFCPATMVFSHWYGDDAH